MQDANEITDRWKQEQEWTTNASDEVEHNQTKTMFIRDGFYSSVAVFVWRQNVSIMWQIVFATENGVIDPPKGI